MADSEKLVTNRRNWGLQIIATGLLVVSQAGMLISAGPTGLRWSLLVLAVILLTAASVAFVRSTLALRAERSKGE
jgi:Kef-type K+ transport system membrane component KefB